MRCKIAQIYTVILYFTKKKTKTNAQKPNCTAAQLAKQNQTKKLVRPRRLEWTARLQ